MLQKPIKFRNISLKLSFPHTYYLRFIWTIWIKFNGLYVNWHFWLRNELFTIASPQNVFCWNGIFFLWITFLRIIVSIFEMLSCAAIHFSSFHWKCFAYLFTIYSMQFISRFCLSVGDRWIIIFYVKTDNSFKRNEKYEKWNKSYLKLINWNIITHNIWTTFIK